MARLQTVLQDREVRKTVAELALSQAGGGRAARLDELGPEEARELEQRYTATVSALAEKRAPHLADSFATAAAMSALAERGNHDPDEQQLFAEVKRLAGERFRGVGS